MKSADSQFELLRNRVARYCDGTLSADDTAALEQQLRDDPKAMDFFLLYTAMHSEIAWDVSACNEQRMAAAEEQTPTDFAARSLAATSLMPNTETPTTGETPLGNQFASPRIASDTVFSRPSWQEYVVPCLASIAIMAVIGFGLWMWKISDSGLGSHSGVAAVQGDAAIAENAKNFATPLSNAVTTEEPLRSKSAPQHVVGHITAELDCRWTRDKGRGARGEGTENHKSLVAFGDQLAVASGLLEITFDAGSKVTLEGPCRFNVETNGGFLAVGRLTGKMEKGGEGRGTRGEGRKTSDMISNNRLAPASTPGAKVGGSQLVVDSAKPQAASNEFTSHQPLATSHSFVIATPTAIVTDLGTEFGVEVDNYGASEVHVLKGLVQAKFLDAHGKTFQSIELKQGEARHYDRKTKLAAVIAVDREKYGQRQFEAMEKRCRDRWAAYSQQLRKDPSLVAYYPLEAANSGSSLLKNASSAGAEMDGVVVGARWANGRLPGKASLWFHATGDHVALPHAERFQFKKAFSIALWFQLHGYAGPEHALIAKGDLGWRILQRSDMPGITFDTNSGPIGNSDKLYNNFGRAIIEDDAWHHVVAVYQKDHFVDHQYIYIDGQLDCRGDEPHPLTQTDEPVWIGNNSQHPKRFFCGWIDEAAVFSRALSADEVSAMYGSDVAAWRKVLQKEGQKSK